MQHLDDGTIQELVDGEVPSNDLVPIQAHLATCGACQSRLDAARMAASEADELLFMLDEADSGAMAAPADMLPYKRPHWSRNLAWAASLILAAGLGFAGRDIIMPPAQVSDAVDSPAPDSPRLRDAATGGQPVTLPGTLTTVEEREPPSERVARDIEPGRESRNDVAAAPAPAPVSPASREPAEVGGAIAPAEIMRQSVQGTAEQESAIGFRRERATTAPTAQLSGATPTPGRVQSFETADAAKSSADPARSMVAVRTVELPAAMRVLGGSIKLIDGLVPDRLEAIGNEVRVVYQVFWGDLLLTQRRDGERIAWQLTAPAGFPADSLAVLRGKVRP